MIDVHAAGVSFPEVLQTRGEYQIKPDLPFVPGSEVAGTVRSAPEGSGLSEGDRVAPAACSAPGPRSPWRPDFLTFELSDELDYAQGAGLILNYHTAYFSLTHRGRLHGGRDGAGSRRGRRGRHRGAPGGEGARRPDDRRRVERRQGACRARGGRRRGRPLGRALEGRGEGAVGRRRGHRHRPRRRRSLHRQPPVAARERPARGRRASPAARSPR